MERKFINVFEEEGETESVKFKTNFTSMLLKSLYLEVFYIFLWKLEILIQHFGLCEWHLVTGKFKNIVISFINEIRKLNLKFALLYRSNKLRFTTAGYYLIIQHFGKISLSILANTILRKRTKSTKHYTIVIH